VVDGGGGDDRVGGGGRVELEGDGHGHVRGCGGIQLAGPGTGFVGAPGGTCKEAQDEDQQQAAGEQERRRKYHCAHDKEKTMADQVKFRLNTKLPFHAPVDPKTHFPILITSQSTGGFGILWLAVRSVQGDFLLFHFFHFLSFSPRELEEVLDLERFL
jgi:hypothetical protein